MRLDPGLRALRADDRPQRDAQGALYRKVGAWRETAEMRALEAELADFAGGGPLEDFALLSACFDPEGGAAATLVGRFVSAVVAALAEAPLGQVPLRHFTDGTHSTLLLGRSGAVTLALAAVDGAGLARRPAPGAVSFPPNQSWEHILAGTARAELVDAPGMGPGPAPLERRPIVLEAGTVLMRDSRRRALLLHEVRGRLVTLRLQRRLPGSEVCREHRLADGALVHQSAGSARDSRLELAASMLARMGRADAAPLLAAMAQEDGSPGLRWQVLRECLALDTREGFAALAAIAAAPGDPLAVPAGALRAQLIECHPVLGELEPCPG